MDDTDVYGEEYDDIYRGEYRFEFRPSEMEDVKRFLKEKLRTIPLRVSRKTVDVYAGDKRVMPPGTRKPGPWTNDVTPYTVETMRMMSPLSHVQRDIVMKAHQGGWTAAAENIACFYMDECPADVLFMSAGDDILERWMSRRLEPAIDSFDIRRLFSMGHERNSASRGTGDKADSKSYPGGRFDIASGRSSGKMRATDKRVLIRDEIDGVPAMLTTGEGYWLETSYARTSSWGHLRKVLDFGTPTTYDVSETWKAFQEGDQRQFRVPCPHCGKYQTLEFGDPANTRHGVKPVTKAGDTVGAVYVCEHCHDPVNHTEKYKMMIAGRWEPTTKPSDPDWVSRHWPGVYSPFLSWYDLYKVYNRSVAKPNGMRTWRNLYEGMPYKDDGARMSRERLISLRSTYPSGEVPEGVIFLTVAFDVQKGSEKDPSNPPRIEYEVLGHGMDYRTWSVDYQVVEGRTEGTGFEGAFEKLYQKIRKGEMKYRRRDGLEFNVLRGFMDSGWNSPAVVDFCGRVKNFFACKGEGATFKPDDTVDKRTKGGYRRYKKSKNTNYDLYLIATNEYKHMLRSALQLKRREHGEQLPRFCSFPSNYTPAYFDQLNAEELMTDGSFDSHGRATEALDCRVYNMCAADSLLTEELELHRDRMVKSGKYSKQEAWALKKVHIVEKIRRNVDDRASKLKVDVPEDTADPDSVVKKV